MDTSSQNMEQRPVNDIVTLWDFHGREYTVSIGTIDSPLLSILISDNETGEEWRCSHDQNYVEDLTRRTGSFKPFRVFMTMLIDAFLKTAKSMVELPLGDLQQLRNERHFRGLRLVAVKEFGGGPRVQLRNLFIRMEDVGSVPQQVPVVGQQQQNSCEDRNNRFLIMTYLTEFDSINYSIPLVYSSPPDPIRRQGNEMLSSTNTDPQGGFAPKIKILHVITKQGNEMLRKTIQVKLDCNIEIYQARAPIVPMNLELTLSRSDLDLNLLELEDPDVIRMQGNVMLTRNTNTDLQVQVDFNIEFRKAIRMQGNEMLRNTNTDLQVQSDFIIEIRQGDMTPRAYARSHFGDLNLQEAISNVGWEHSNHDISDRIRSLQIERANFEQEIRTEQRIQDIESSKKILVWAMLICCFILYWLFISLLYLLFV